MIVESREANSWELLSYSSGSWEKSAWLKLVSPQGNMKRIRVIRYNVRVLSVKVRIGGTKKWSSPEHAMEKKTGLYFA